MTYSSSVSFNVSSTPLMIISIALSVLVIIAIWKIFTKAGVPGWHAIIPFLNIYSMFKIIYGNGWKFLLLLIPFFNIYVAIKYCLDLAKVYGKSAGFGVLTIFFGTICMLILGFGNSIYQGPIVKNK